MKYSIRTRKHRAWPIRLGIWWRKTTIARKVYFDPSCKYTLHGEDMHDTNKLFGIGYFPSHHRYSARFGWRYNPDTDKITVSAYLYDNGQRTIVNLCDLKIFTWYNFTIRVLKDAYIFEVENSDRPHYRLAQYSANKYHNKKLSYPLGIYFGGNKSAPHTIHIEMKKL